MHEPAGGLHAALAVPAHCSPKSTVLLPQTTLQTQAASLRPGAVGVGRPVAFLARLIQLPVAAVRGAERLQVADGTRSGETRRAVDGRARRARIGKRSRPASASTYPGRPFARSDR
jgi:hypothetical protein